MSFKKFINEANEAIKFALKHLDIQNEGYTLTEPTKENFGDLSCNAAFLLTKRLQKSPSEIASILAEQCRCYIDAIQTKSQSYVLSVVAHESGYINFKGDFGLIGKEILSDILENHLNLDTGKRTKVIIEHTSVNPNKALHVGHLRNVVIGDTLYRILKKTNRLHVIVEAHRSDAELLRDATHRDGLEALLVREGDCNRCYLLPAEPRFGS